MTDKLDMRLAEFAAHHHGVFDLAAARDLGATRDEIHWRVRCGRWVRVYDEVFLVGGAPFTWKARLAAACFAGGPEAFASHRAAASQYRLPGGHDTHVEITCRRWRRAKESGLVVHETKAFDTGDIRLVDRIPTASPELALVQLGAVCSRHTVEEAYDAARRKDLVSEASVRHLLRRIGQRGRNGVGVLRSILDDRAGIAAVPESVMETRVLRCLRRLGLPDPVPQFEVRHQGTFVARVDFAYPDARVAIEYQSYEHHTGHIAGVRDTARRRALKRIDWDVVDVTYDDVTQGCRDVGATLAISCHAPRRAPRSDAVGTRLTRTGDAKTGCGYQTSSRFSTVRRPEAYSSSMPGLSS